MLAYLNTDLEITSRGALDLLHAELDNALFGLYAGKGPKRGQRLYTYEPYRQHDGPDAALREFVAVLRALPPAAKRQWRAAVRRDLNIGIEGGLRPRSLELALEPATLAAVVALGARIVITVYAAGRPAKR